MYLFPVVSHQKSFLIVFVVDDLSSLYAKTCSDCAKNVMLSSWIENLPFREILVEVT